VLGSLFRPIAADVAVAAPDGAKVLGVSCRPCHLWKLLGTPISQQIGKVQGEFAPAARVARTWTLIWTLIQVVFLRLMRLTEVLGELC